MDAVEALIEKGYAKEDAERLVAEGHDLLTKADKYDALPSDKEIAEARTAERVERADLDARAAKVGLKAEDTVKLDNADLKATILKEAGIEIPKVDGISEDVAVKFQWEAYKATSKDEPEVRQDEKGNEAKEGEEDEFEVRLDGDFPSFNFSNFDSTNTRK